MVCYDEAITILANANVTSRFLLHYIARDEVDLLDSGISDLSGIRTALAGYNEKSPVYGFINYRGKRILLKYVPTDTSRLLQGKCPLC